MRVVVEPTQPGEFTESPEELRRKLLEGFDRAAVQLLGGPLSQSLRDESAGRVQIVDDLVSRMRIQYLERLEALLQQVAALANDNDSVYDGGGHPRRSGSPFQRLSFGVVWAGLRRRGRVFRIPPC